MSYVLQKPQFTLDDKGNVRSLTHDDVYFSIHGGVEETRYVFLTQNNLPARWKESQDFSICELGFGTGLNFLTTLDAWVKAEKPEGARLHYTSIEYAPFSRGELEKIYVHLPEFQPYIDALLAAYPKRISGKHRVEFSNFGVTLELFFVEAGEGLKQLSGCYDAWFLDGFSPAKNPDMWTKNVCWQMARLSDVGTSFSTFTAAGLVKKGLLAVGFEVQKVKGFGRKRDMLHGEIIEPLHERYHRESKPWYALPEVKKKPESILIVGDGIASASMAYALGKRDYRVYVDRGAKRVETAGSRNPAGVLYPLFANSWSRENRFYMQAYQLVQQWMAEDERSDAYFTQCGVLRLPKQTQDDDELVHIPTNLGLDDDVMQTVDSEDASDLAGISLKRGGVFLPQSGFVDMSKWCDRLFELSGALLSDYDDHGSRERGSFDAVVVCNAQGYEVQDTSSLQYINGQVSFVPETLESSALRTVVCHDGYVTPSFEGRHVAGSTYEKEGGRVVPKVTDGGESENLEKLHGLSDVFSDHAEGGWAGARVAASDRMPVIGAVPDESFYETAYDGLHHGRAPHLFPVGKSLSNFYVSAAHGSRGLLSAPLAAEAIADMIEGNRKNILPNDLREAVHPARFLIRSLK